MLATSKNVLFPGHKHRVLMTLHFNHHPCWHSGDNQSAGSSLPGVSRWLWPGNKTFLDVASMVVTWWIVACLCTCILSVNICQLLYLSPASRVSDGWPEKDKVWIFCAGVNGSSRPFSGSPIKHKVKVKAVFLYCYPDYLRCPAIQMGRAI